ncbi:hypothetical protein NLU13_4346 [Sarocladium strictum]|uniref:Uncharacterized protein n=1 Tax=Sarocladium strictum TaxID=5046 RepID=A0AA39GIP9_SARSR|nr:hypothetical protein NLU13_4346 [Sarocladium strictum]
MLSPSANTEVMCLEHFLNNLDSLPRPKRKKPANCTAKPSDCTANGATRPARRQPSRQAKRATDFYRLENLETLKRARDESEEQRDVLDGRPCKRRRNGIRATNYDVDLGETQARDRASEITWAAARLLLKDVDMHCCFAGQPLVCPECEIKKLKTSEVAGHQSPNELVCQPSPSPSPSPSTNKRRRIKIVGRLASSAPPQKKRIKLVGRLAPTADMKLCKVAVADPTRWDPETRPFMMVRYGDHDFAVDYCKDLLFVPVGSAAAAARQEVDGDVFGYRKYRTARTPRGDK